jgi:hypothetical protein
MPQLKHAVMRGNGQAQISARLEKVPEKDPNFDQRSTPFNLKREKPMTERQRGKAHPIINLIPMPPS